MGRDSVLRRDAGEVISGGSAGWLGFGEEEAAAAAGRGGVAGAEVVNITAVVVVMPCKANGATVVRSRAHGR